MTVLLESLDLTVLLEYFNFATLHKFLRENQLKLLLVLPQGCNA